MSKYFTDLRDFAFDKVVIGSDFDVLKRDPIHSSFIGYNQVSFKMVSKQWKLNCSFLESL